LESINRRARDSYLHLFLNIIEYPFVKGYLEGIIDRSNLRQKIHERKITAEKSKWLQKIRIKNRGCKIATTKLTAKQNCMTENMAVESQNSRTATTESRKQNHGNRIMATETYL
jgi:hypothetical protein